MNFLKIRLKSEKFIKEELWQLLIVVAFVVLFAWIFNKFIETLIFCLTHIIIRPKFDKQYHSKFTSICLFITLNIAFWCILFCLPINISLLFCIPLACFVCWIGFIFEDRLFEKNKNKELLKPKTFSVNNCSEIEIIQRCRELHFSDENTELAVEFFIRKTPHKILADRLFIDEKSVTTRKKRMKAKLNG